MQVEKFYYDNKIVKAFGLATIVFGVVGMLAGLYAFILVQIIIQGHFITVTKSI